MHNLPYTRVRARVNTREHASDEVGRIADQTTPRPVRSIFAALKYIYSSANRLEGGEGRSSKAIRHREHPSLALPPHRPKSSCSPTSPSERERASSFTVVLEITTVQPSHVYGRQRRRRATPRGVKTALARVLELVAMSANRS